MSRILLFEPSKDDATSYYRSRGVLPFMAKGHDIQLIPCDAGHFNWADAVMGDVAFFQRPIGKHLLEKMLLCKDLGVKVIIDWDDNVLDIAEHNPLYGHCRRNLQHILDSLTLADHVIASTQSLGEVYGRYTRNVTVIPNCHNDYLFPVKSKQPFIFNRKAYYRGGSTHQKDVYKYKDQIIDMIKTNPEWLFHFFGDRFLFIEAETEKCDNHLVGGYQNVLEFLRSLIELRPCAYFTFLEDTIFNQGKSNCGWLEATYAGAACFAPLGLHEFDKLPCVVLCTNFTDGFSWKNPEAELKRLHDESWEYIQNNLLLSKVNELRLGVFLG